MYSANMVVIRAALINDYEVVVRGLASMLRSYSDRVRIIELDANRNVTEPVDIALYDSFANPQGNRAQLRQLSANPLVGKVVMYSWNLDPDLVESTMSNGAGGYVSKGLTARELVAALESVHLGTARIHPSLVKTVVSGDWPGREEGLTQRESEVLALITQGQSNAEIADCTGLSINSIKTHIRTCYRKIGAASRSQALLWGVEHGFRPDHAKLIPK